MWPEPPGPFSHFGGNQMDLCDNINFISKSVFGDIMEVFGWRLVDNFKCYKNLAILRADFYPIGHIIGVSDKAYIVCDGEMSVVYKGREYNDINDLLYEYGEKVYETFPEWEIRVEKQWAIKTYDGDEWVAAFTNLAEMPYRKQVKC